MPGQIVAHGVKWGQFGAWRSPASALAWGARGRRFKSSRPDHKQIRNDLFFFYSSSCLTYIHLSLIMVKISVLNDFSELMNEPV